MTTHSIDVMLSKPGIYVVMTEVSMGLAEVDAAGVCYQLELASGAYRRDGELRPGLWMLENIIGIEGPFARMPGVTDG